MKSFLIFILLISLSPYAHAQTCDDINSGDKDLLTRNTRIKEYNNQITAVVPFYQWYLDKFGLEKDDFRNLSYPFKSEKGIAQPFMMNRWGQSGGDKRVKLAFKYDSVPTCDVITIKGHKLIIRYVSQEEFLK